VEKTFGNPDGCAYHYWKLTLLVTIESVFSWWTRFLRLQQLRNLEETDACVVTVLHGHFEANAGTPFSCVKYAVFL